MGKQSGALENLRPVRLDELEVCIRLKGDFLTISLLSLLTSQVVGGRRCMNLIQLYLVGSRIDELPQLFGNYVWHRPVSTASVLYRLSKYKEDVTSLRSISKLSQST